MSWQAAKPSCNGDLQFHSRRLQNTWQ